MHANHRYNRIYIYNIIIIGYRPRWIRDTRYVYIMDLLLQRGIDGCFILYLY